MLLYTLCRSLKTINFVCCFANCSHRNKKVSWPVIHLSTYWRIIRESFVNLDLNERNVSVVNIGPKGT